MLAKKTLVYTDGVTIEKTYYTNGKRKSYHEFFDDHLHGVTKHWHPNGVLAKEIHYVKDQRVGPYKEWDENGNLIIDKFNSA